MKLIDVWLAFGLVLPFVAFCLEVAEALVSQSEEGSTEGSEKARPITVSSSNSIIIQKEKFLAKDEKKSICCTKQSVLRFLAQRFLPSFAVIFILSYIIVCIYSFDNPVLEYD